jgi:hypothetical protein
LVGILKKHKDSIETYFTRSDGKYIFARWGRPIAPVVFGVQDETLETLKSVIQSIVVLANHELVETDPELGSNAMFFFFLSWDELLEVKDLDRIIPDLGNLVERLKSIQANQYRFFRFDAAGGIKAVFTFICMDHNLASVSAEVLCLSQVVQMFLLWSDDAFKEKSPTLITNNGAVILNPIIGDIVRAVYEPTMPIVSTDKSHALRAQARIDLFRKNLA